jgi:glycosyltransferase involved in cell wall biosynthesis
MNHLRVALLACTNVIGGHEFQAAALAKSLAEHVSVTVFVNHPDHVKVFEDAGLEIRIVEGVLLEPGLLPKQLLNGWLHRTEIRSLVEGFDHVIVSAGAVEAGVAVGLALRRGTRPLSMYLPSFYDRVPLWGWKGHLYNCALGVACRLFNFIITINRIQARVIHAFSGVPTLVVGNRIRQVHLPVEQGPSRLVFVGRMDQQKRIGELMRWLDSDLNPINNLLLIGDGPLRQLLERQSLESKHLNCTFLGSLKPQDQDRLIRATDVLMLNSLIEGEPLVVREARARGMNILVRDIVGTRGVTSRKERFSSQMELLDRLSAIAAFKVKSCETRIAAKQPLKVEKMRNKNIISLLGMMAEAR